MDEWGSPTEMGASGDEVRAIPDQVAVEGLGSLLASIGAEAGGFDLVVDRDGTLHEPLVFTQSSSTRP